MKTNLKCPNCENLITCDDEPEDDGYADDYDEGDVVYLASCDCGIDELLVIKSSDGKMRLEQI